MSRSELFSVWDAHETLLTYTAADATATMGMFRGLYGAAPLQPEGEPMNRLDVVEAEIRRLQKERAILARFPKDTFADGTVLKFEKVFGSWEDTLDSDVLVKYTYAAIKADGRWYLTGPKACYTSYKWSELIEWMGDGVNEIWSMEQFRDILNNWTDAELATGTVGTYTGPSYDAAASGSEATDVGLEEKHGSVETEA